MVVVVMFAVVSMLKGKMTIHAMFASRDQAQSYLDADEGAIYWEAEVKLISFTNPQEHEG